MVWPSLSIPSTIVCPSAQYDDAGARLKGAVGILG